MVPKISVFITSYNQKAFLVEAIDSVLSQTLKPFELIVVDDCSTDGSQEVIGEYARRNPNLIRPYYQATNVGIAANKAFAQQHVKGDWLTYLDGDDRFLPQKLELEWLTLQADPQAQVVFSDFYRIDSGGRRLSRWAAESDPPHGNVFAPVFSRRYPARMLFRNELVAFSCLEKIGFYDKNCRCYEDWDLKIRLAKRFRIAYTREPLIEYRCHPGGISATSGRAFLLRQMLRIYHKNSALLGDAGSEEKRQIQNDLFEFFCDRSKAVVEDAFSKGDRTKAVYYCFKFFRWIRFKDWIDFILRGFIWTGGN